MALRQKKSVEESPADIAFDTFGTLMDNDITVPGFEPSRFGSKRWEASNFSRRTRLRTSFRNFNLPPVEDKQGLNQANRSVFTSRYNWGNWTVETAVQHLVDSGQFENHVADIHDAYDVTREEAKMIASYNVFIVAKGWVAESQVSEIDGISKLWETNDVAGQDFQKGDEYLQLKSYTFALHDLDYTGDATLVFYGWAGGDIVVSTNYKDVTNAIMDEHKHDQDVLRTHEWTEKPHWA